MSTRNIVAHSNNNKSFDGRDGGIKKTVFSYRLK